MPSLRPPPTPMIEPMAYVTSAAASPMPSWRAPGEEQTAAGQQADRGADREERDEAESRGWRPGPRSRRRTGTGGPARPRRSRRRGTSPAAAPSGEPSWSGSSPSSSRTSMSSAVVGVRGRSGGRSVAASCGEKPLARYAAASSASSSSGIASISARSSAIWRSNSSRWLCIEMYSPAAMLNAPASRPAMPGQQDEARVARRPRRPRP